MKAIKNCKILTEQGMVESQALVFDRQIREIIPEEKLSPGLEVIDGAGGYLSPGLLDLHMHGCAGFDAMDDDERAIEMIARRVVATGVTAFLPTTMTMKFDRIGRALGRIRKAMKGRVGAQVLGANLEGPFLSKKYKGAHDERYIIPPDFTLISSYDDVIRLLTVAPEEAGALALIEQATRSGIVVALGHSNATFEEAVRGVTAGAAHVTHLFNAMSPLHHRRPGVVGAALFTEVTCELIADNIHLVPPVQKLVLHSKGLDRLLLVTDAMRACLLPEGQYDLGGQIVYVADHQARLANGSLAGSTLVMNQAIRNFMTGTGLGLEEAIKPATLNPARLLGIEGKKGSIALGKDADLTLLDEELNVLMTIVGGEIVYAGS